jgi:glycosyltransferase involved in cell wall biosynthesis
MSARNDAADTVSVVIPSFNRARLIEATVDSILAQTNAPLEVLIVDDGSTDDTEEVCRSFPAPVRYIRQENTGLPGARNTGIRQARGDWVALCDSDDLWHSRKLEEQLRVLREVGNAGWCITDCALIDPNGRSVGSCISGFEYVFPVFRAYGQSPRELFGRYLQEQVLLGDETSPVTYFAGDVFDLLFHGNFALPSSALVSRSLFERVGLFDESFRWAEDTEFFHRAAASSPVAVVMAPLVDYRVGHPSMITSGEGTLRLIENALVSLDRALRLRPSPAESTRAAYIEGRRRLQLHLAYARLSAFDGRGARRAVLEHARERGAVSAQGAAILLASLLPARVLRGMHRMKRGLRG